MKTFTAVIRKDEELFVAYCPEVGTTSQGKTVKQALKNLKEATELYLEEFPTKKYSTPILTTFEVIENIKKSKFRELLIHNKGTVSIDKALDKAKKKYCLN